MLASQEVTVAGAAPASTGRLNCFLRSAAKKKTSTTKLAKNSRTEVEVGTEEPARGSHLCSGR